MLKLLPIVFSITTSIASGQISVVRKNFFDQRIATLSSELKDKYNLVRISDNRIIWDSTSSQYKEYLMAFDTTDLNDLSVKHTPTKKKIEL